MRSNPRTILFTFFTLLLALAIGGFSNVSAQGKGPKGGNKGGGGQPQRQAAPKMQRPQPQMRQQAQRPMPQVRQQAQRTMPQMNRQAREPQRQDRQVVRHQTQPRQAQRQAVQTQRQNPRVQRDQAREPRFDQRIQRQKQSGNVRDNSARAQQRVDRQRPGVIRVPRQDDRGRGNGKFDNQSADIRQKSGRDKMSGQERGQGRASRFEDRQRGVQQLTKEGRGGTPLRRDAGILTLQNGDVRGVKNDGRRERFDASRVDLRGFRDQERAWRRQARNEGWVFNETDFRTNVFVFRQREAWRADVLRSVISLNIGFGNDYYYIPPPQYPAFYGVNYEPWNYNIGYTHYDPYYSSFYVEPRYQAYMPYDYYYSSYYYDDPYYFDDPYDDYVTYRVFSSSSSGVGGFVTRVLGGLLAYGYDKGYRDGLIARQGGYGYSDYYYDPYVYNYAQPSYTATYTTTAYQPYLYGAYEDRHCLSQGYSLGYEDAFYERNNYDPGYGNSNMNIVSLYVGATFQIA